MKQHRDIPSDVSRADLLRVGLDPRLGEIVGFVHDVARRKQKDAEKQKQEESESHFSQSTEAAVSQLAPPIPKGPLAPIEFLIPTKFSHRPIAVQSTSHDTLTKASPVWENRPTLPPRFISLADEGRLKRLYSLFTPGRRETRAPDAVSVIAHVAKARPLKSIPRKSYKTARHMQIVADRSARLAPFWQDQKWAMLAAPSSSHFWMFEEAAGRFRKIGEQRYSSPRPEDGPIVVLGDLGAFGGGETKATWQQLGEYFAVAGESACAILPCDADDVPPHLLDLWTVQPWEHPFGPSHAEKRERDVEHMLMLASYAARLEPGLLRALRRGLTQAEAVTELLLYKHPAVASPSAEAATLDPQKIATYRRKFEQFAREHPDQARKAWSILRQWREPIGDEFMFEELMSLPPDLRDLLEIDQEDISHAQAFWCSMQSMGAAGQLSQRAAVWLRSAGRRRKTDPDGLFTYGPARDVLRLAMARQNGGTLEEQELSVSLKGNQLCFGSSEGSLLGHVRTGDGEVALSNSFRDNLSNGSLGPEMIMVPAGTFLMGSPDTEEGRFENEGPQQRITFAEPFALARYPVTFDEYDAFCEATGRTKPNASGMGRGRRPAIKIDWRDAWDYCAWLSTETGEPYHLPSEAAWEYACRAGTTTRYNWGNQWDPQKANGDSSIEKTTEVGGYDVNLWGFHDMHGNVLEWCDDAWKASHDGAAVDGSARQASHQVGGTSRVLRGGSWNKSAKLCRSANRRSSAPDNRDGYFGFRPARGQQGAQASSQSAERTGVGRAKASRTEPTAVHGLGNAVADKPLERLRVTPDSDASLDLRKLPATPFVIRTDRAELVIQRTTLSDLKWASGLGRDRFGMWAEIAVDDLRPRLRYCPPGRFMMGSPDDEPGRNANEGPQTEVTFETGFWLFETPVTQALYQAVMPDLKNPSRFQSPLRPVDQVSWDNAVDFLAALNGRIPELELHLPSEAAWEYACRAGTTAATYAGPMDIRGENDAPVLDDIAWYSGNSGVNFDLEEGHDSSDWPEKQYDHKKAGTRIVAQKKANPWGLFDMHGNVWEWCGDLWNDTHRGAAADGSPRLVSQQDGETSRVVRAGSGSIYARYCRSASRSRSEPDYRHDSLGFRPARGQQGAMASKQVSADRVGPSRAEASRAEPTAERSTGLPRGKRGDVSGDFSDAKLSGKDDA